MKKQLDMAKIAQRLGAARRGTVSAKSGCFGALGLVAEVEARFRARNGWKAILARCAPVRTPRSAAPSIESLLVGSGSAGTAR